jgi:hypothetical protein
MLLLPDRRPRDRSGLRAALLSARETYRAHSRPGRRREDAPAPAPAAVPVPPPAAPVARRPEDPDVLLDVPTLRVDDIDLEVDDLRAKVALAANVLDLVRLDVGVEAELGRVHLGIKGVDAQALLKVRLDNLTAIVDRVLTTVDRNPQLLERLVENLGRTLGPVGSGAGSAVSELGHAGASALDKAAR